MNELRQKIHDAVWPEGPGLEMLAPEGHAKINAILDAVITALPFASADDEDGYVAAISEVTSLLEAAKENK